MNRKTILVIEDDDMNRKLVRTLLEIGGYEIMEARDAETGLELAGAQKPDLILMDIQLPGMDGLDATRLLKQDPATAGIPVVALTSYAMQGDEEKALDAGCAGYMSKPIDTRKFLQELERYL